MDNHPLVSYVLATYNRPNDLSEAIDSILNQSYEPLEVIVVSSSTDDTADMFEPGGRFDDDRVHYHGYLERMGVPKARNIGYELASGEIFVLIDDDAVIANPDATETIVSRFETHGDVGVLAFQSRNYHTDELIPKEIPEPPDFNTPPTEEYRTTGFIGVGNAIRRSVFEDVGGFPPKFIYGFEEMDLSMRALDSGYDILYVPSVVVRHKKSPKARRPDLEVIERQVENRIRLTIRNLPWRYVIFSTIVWAVYGFVRSKFRVRSLGRIFWNVWTGRNELLSERTVVDGHTIKLLKSRSSTLFCWWYGPDPRRIIGPHGRLRRLFW